MFHTIESLKGMDSTKTETYNNTLFARTLECTFRHFACGGQECRMGLIKTCRYKGALVCFYQSVYIMAFELLIVGDKQKK